MLGYSQGFKKRSKTEKLHPRGKGLGSLRNLIATAIVRGHMSRILSTIFHNIKDRDITVTATATWL